MSSQDYARMNMSSLRNPINLTTADEQIELLAQSAQWPSAQGGITGKMMAAGTSRRSPVQKKKTQLKKGESQNRF